jgi:class 3 adenylate cyclase
LSFINRNQIFGGENLDSVYNKLKGYVHFGRQTQVPITTHHLLALGRMVTSLSGKESEESFYGEFTNPDVHLKFLIDNLDLGLHLSLAGFYIFDSAKHYFLNEYEKAYELAEKAIPLLPAVLGLAETGEHNFYHSLSILALLKKKHPQEKELLAKLVENQNMMKLWAKSAPGNFKAKYLFIESELALFKKKYARAAELYNETINEGQRSNLPHVTGIIFERCAEYYFNKGFNDLANLLIRDSWLEYGKWGAVVKVKQLESNYPQLSQIWESHDKNMRKASSFGMNNLTTSSSSIDLQSIFKASTSISEEVVFERLLDKLLKILIENAGAQNGYIVMVRDGKLFVEAASKMDKGSQFEFQNNPLASVAGIPKAIVQLVFYTSETLILNDAAADNRFAKDDYIQDIKPKSILCLPILLQGKCIAIVYLENLIASDVFTPARLEVLNLLSGQMAVSINNALLYANLEHKVAERTAEIELQKELIEIEKNKSDLLLLNILPYEIAEELKKTGKSVPKKYDNVSVMFTDFKGFTQISEKLDPETLVSKIDTFFGEFDRIMDKHGVEKIKTIGDAYMCVSGLPIEATDHALDIINAAIEIQEYMDQHKAEALARGENYFEIRIGVNSGPVVAGVVGSKKFAFDIWGDTVNTAARMESNAQVGQINISGSTYELVKDHFECTSRGKIEAKHKGEIEMFFVGNRKVN